MMRSDLKNELKKTMDKLAAEIIDKRRELDQLTKLDEEINSMAHTYVAIGELIQVKPNPEILKSVN